MWFTAVWLAVFVTLLNTQANAEEVTVFEITSESIYLRATKEVSVTVSTNKFEKSIVIKKENEKMEKNVTGLAADTLYTFEYYDTGFNYVAMWIPTLPTVADRKIKNVRAKDVWDTRMTIFWESDQNAAVLVKSLILQVNNQNVTLEIDATMFTLSSLKKSTSYIIQLHAELHDGTFIMSMPITVMTLASVENARNLVVSDVYEDSFDLYWEKKSAVVDPYTVHVKDHTSTFKTSSNYLYVAGLNQTFASHKVDVRPTSEPNTLDVYLNNEIRPTFQNVRALKASKDELVISWEMSETYINGNLHYREIGNSTTRIEFINNAMTEYTLSELNPNKEYEIHLNAHINLTAGRSTPKMKVKTLPTDENSIVNIIQSRVYADSITLQWSGRVDGNATYELTVSTVANMKYSTDQNNITIFDIPGPSYVVTIKVTELNGVATTRDIQETVNVNVIDSALYKPIMNQFQITSITTTTIGVMWLRIKDSWSYTMNYNFANGTQIGAVHYNETGFIIKRHSFDGLTSNTEYSIQMTVYAGVDVLKSRNMVATTGNYSNAIDLQIVNVYDDSIDIYWSKLSDDYDKKYEIITTPKQPNYPTSNQIDNSLGRRVTLWGLTELNYQVSVKEYRENVVDGVTPVASNPIDVALTKVKREQLATPMVTEISQTAITVEWNKYMDITGYRIYSHLSSASPSTAQLNYTDVPTDDPMKYKFVIKDLIKGTEYKVWIEVISRTLYTVRSPVVSTTTLNTDLTAISNIKVVNKYKNAYDLKWDAYPQAQEYRVKITSPTTTTLDKVFTMNSASIDLSDTTETKFDVNVFLQKRLDEVVAADTVKSSTIVVDLPIEGERPSLYLWVANKTQNTIKLGWNAASAQATFQIHQTCMNPDKSVSRVMMSDGGMLWYTATHVDDDTALDYGTTCTFQVSVNSMNAKPYHFDYKSNVVTVHLYDKFTINRDGSSGTMIHSSTILMMSAFMVLMFVNYNN